MAAVTPEKWENVGVYCHLVALKDAVIPAQSVAGA